ncbi:tyrosine-type recombinase/integrase [Microbacterium sp. H37-C3]|uniref:tyrosine-type recombinase/integrase n=1 Tax=Microbacterium sp. H37-C3 TaxID=3004354 RepID=UPI0022AFD9A1|nr:tyrosine-type recombinase/integrase [Microbacterium sp. H37-C3]MCZ4069226.1 tyrosine-type recombinase/integrase [Microbacterium sp. H37-C3]
MADITVPSAANRNLARASFLARQKGGTRSLYEIDIRILFEWCDSMGLDVLALKRPHLELFIEYLMGERGNSPVSVQRRITVIRSFYRLAHSDELVDRDPTVMLKMPRVRKDPESIAWLEPHEVSRLLDVAAATSPAHHALIALMSMLALRVSEACAVRLEDFAEDKAGYPALLVHSKGGYEDVMPAPIPLLRIRDAAAGERTTGPLVTTRAGARQTRNGAYDWTRRLARRAELRSDLHPHSLRHSAITALVDSGADILTVMRFARHRDPRFAEHYYRRRDNFDGHGAHAVARMFSR